MYHLLIEAGGMQQLERVNAEWAATFVDDLHQTARDHGFDLSLAEADWLLFSWSGQRVPEPDAIARFVRGVSDVVERGSETLLGYSVVVDFDDTGAREPAARLSHMLGLLSRTDRDNGTWLTAAALGGIEACVETTLLGRLYLIQGYRMDRSYGVPEYNSAVDDTEFRARLMQRLESASGGGYSSRIIVRGEDIHQLVANVVAVSVDVAGEPAPVIWWSPVPNHDDAAATALALVLSIRDDDRTARINAREEHANLADYIRRFSARSNVYLSPGWRSGELRVAGTLVSEFLQRERRPLVVLVDSQSLSSTAKTELERLFGSESSVTLIDCVATGIADVVLEPQTPSWVGGGRTGAHVTAVYWRELALERGAAATSFDKPPSPDSSLAALLDTYDLDYAAALWVWARSKGVLANATVDALFPHCGISLAERSRIREESRRNGMAPDGCGLDLSRLVTLEIVEKRLGSEAASLRERYDAALLELIDSGQCNLTPEVWELVRVGAPRPVRFALWHRLVHSLAAGGAPEIVESIVSPDHSGDRVMAASTLSATVRAGLRDSRGPDEVADDATKLVAVSEDESMPKNVRIDALLTYGEYDLAIRAYENALKHAKGAMYLSQADDPGGTAPSHLLLARIMLARRRVADAGSYLNYAREIAEGRDQATLFVATVFELIRLFLYGNLSGVERGAMALEPALRDAGFTEWVVQVGFLRGRVSFELGDYDAARERFVRLANFCVECGMHAPGSVAAAWQLRASGFQGRPLKELLDAFAMLGRRPEAMLFAAEARLRSGAYDEALQTLDEVGAMERGKVWWPRLGVCWTDGFAAVEDALLATEPGDSMLSRLTSAYRAVALANCDRSDEAVGLFHALTRETEGLLHDPFGGFYNYLYSTILPKEGRRDRDDRLTVLGKAVKFVQERNSKIEDYHDKVRFLQANDWNRRLMEAARGHNLV